VRIPLLEFASKSFVLNLFHGALYKKAADRSCTHVCFPSELLNSFIKEVIMSDIIDITAFLPAWAPLRDRILEDSSILRAERRGWTDFPRGVGSVIKDILVTVDASYRCVSKDMRGLRRAQKTFWTAPSKHTISGFFKQLQNLPAFAILVGAIHIAEQMISEDDVVDKMSRAQEATMFVLDTFNIRGDTLLRVAKNEMDAPTMAHILSPRMPSPAPPSPRSPVPRSPVSPTAYSPLERRTAVGISASVGEVPEIATGPSTRRIK